MNAFPMQDLPWGVRRLMKTQPLGQTGLQVSAFCLGAMRFGTTTDEATSFAILDEYMSAGGAFVDTANVYAAWGGGKGGESETVLGRWLRKRETRAGLFIATKAGSRLQSGGRSLRADVLVRECDGSLKRLGIDTIDLYYAHFDDMTLPVEEVVAGLQKLVAAGKVRHLGASNYYTWRLEAMRQASARAGVPTYCCVQQRYSYLQPLTGSSFGTQVFVNEDLLAYLRSQQLPLMAYSPLLGGVYDKPDRDAGPQYAAAVNTERLRVLREVARQKGVTPNQLVYAWLLHHDFPVIPLVAASSVTQLRENLAALTIALTPAEIRQLEIN